MLKKKGTNTGGVGTAVGGGTGRPREGASVGWWVGDGGAWDGMFFSFAFVQGRECATATRSKCKGSKKGKNTAMGGMVSYDGTEPSPGWEERVVGGKLHHPGCGGEVDEIMLRLTYKFIW